MLWSDTLRRTRHGGIRRPPAHEPGVIAPPEPPRRCVRSATERRMLDARARQQGADVGGGSVQARVRGGSALATLIVLLLLAALPARAGAAAWLDPIGLSSPQTTTSVGCGFFCATVYFGATGVDVAVNARGDAIAAWSRRSDGGNVMIVQASFRPAGGTFGAAQDIGTTTAPSGFLFFSGPLMATAIDDQGNAAVVWPSTDSGHTVVDIATKPLGTSFGAAQRLTDNTKDVGTDHASR